VAGANQTKPVGAETALKVLLYDLETSPNIGYTWGTWDQSVIEIIRHRQIISFAWKWLGDNEPQVLSLRSFSGYRRDKESNKALVKSLYALISKADVSVAHNGISFDDKRSNTDIIKNDLPPPPHRQSIDTLAFARHKFGFNSNRLDDLGEFLGLGRKVKHPGFAMWKGCLDGDDKSWDLMEKYNRGDIDLLEKVYLKLRPWMDRHPNMNLRGGSPDHCPRCQSKNVFRKGHRYNLTTKIERFRCLDCGRWSTGKKLKNDPRWRFN
jgi:hypothetical protein